MVFRLFKRANRTRVHNMVSENSQSEVRSAPNAWTVEGRQHRQLAADQGTTVATRNANRTNLNTSNSTPLQMLQLDFKHVSEMENRIGVAMMNITGLLKKDVNKIQLLDILDDPGEKMEDSRITTGEATARSMDTDEDRGRATERNRARSWEEEDWEEDGSGEGSFHSCYYQTVRPLAVLAFLLALTPVTMTRTGPRFRLLSLATLYCCLVYALWLFYTGLQVRERLVHLASNSFDEHVSFYRGMLYLCSHPCVPLVCWARAPQLVRYLYRWSRFETRYRQVTGTMLITSSGLRRLALVLALSCAPVAALMVFQQTAKKPFFNQWYAPVNTYALMTQMLLGSWWNCSFLAIAAVGRSFQHELKESVTQAITQGERGLEVVRRFHALWLPLRELVHTTGSALYGAMLLHATLLFFKLTLCSYGLTARLVRPAYRTEEPADMALNVLVLAGEIVLANQLAHRARHQVHQGIKEQLEALMMAPGTKHEMAVEILMFGKTLQLNPTVISLGGFVEYNRQLLVTTLSTMVTYLIVLLQFRLSIDDGSGKITPVMCSPNSTQYH